MSDDMELADLLGEPPRTPDTAFRFDVFARVAEAARRRRARERALLQVAAFVAIGLAFAVLQASGLTWAEAQPVLVTAAALTVAAATALLTIQGPGVVLARSRALLRVPVLRA